MKTKLELEHELTNARQSLGFAVQQLNAVARIITTIELCREGVWEEHKPALDSILRDFNQAGFDISPDTLAEVTSERLYN
jgi:hypothetical protein